MKKIKCWCIFQAKHPQNLKLKKLRLGYVYIKESFDTIFNMCYGGPWLMGRENLPWPKGLPFRFRMPFTSHTNILGRVTDSPGFYPDWLSRNKTDPKVMKSRIRIRLSKNSPVPDPDTALFDPMKFTFSLETSQYYWYSKIVS